MVEGMPGALAAEPQISAVEAKAMAKSGRLALAEKAKPNKIPSQPPPQRRIVVMTLGVQLCLRWFIEGQRITGAEAVHRLNRQSQQHGKGEGRGPAGDEADVEPTATAMLIVTSRPQGNIVVVDARGFRSAQKDKYHIGTHYPNLKDITRHREFQGAWARTITKLRDQILAKPG